MKVRGLIVCQHEIKKMRRRERQRGVPRTPQARYKNLNHCFTKLQRFKQRDLARYTIIQENGIQMRRDKVYLVSPDTDEVSIYYLLFVEFGMGRAAWVIGNQAQRSSRLLCFGDLLPGRSDLAGTSRA